MTTGEKIKKYRLKAGVTQMQLDISLQTGFGHTSRIEKGRVNPTKETILNISRILKLTESEMQNLLDVPSFETEFFQFVKLFVSDINCEYIHGQDTARNACNKSLETKEDIFFVANIGKWRNVYSENIGLIEYIPNRLENKLFLKTLVDKELADKDYINKDHEAFRKSIEKPEVIFNTFSLFANNEKTIAISYLNPNNAIIIKAGIVNKFIYRYFETLWPYNLG